MKWEKKHWFTLKKGPYGHYFYIIMFFIFLFCFCGSFVFWAISYYLSVIIFNSVLDFVQFQFS